MQRPPAPPATVPRPSYRPRCSRIIVDAANRHAVVDGHSYGLVALSKTSWRVVDLETNESSWFRLAADPDGGGWIVREAEGEHAASVGAAWVWSCQQISKSPLPPRPPFH